MLPSESLPMPSCWRNLLEEAGRRVFARRSTLRLFLVLASGLVLAERGTVVAMAAAGGIAGQCRRACWFFAGAVWDADALGLAVARLIVKYLPAGRAGHGGDRRHLLPAVGTEDLYLELSRQLGP